MNMEKGSNEKAAPTGCYKCGRPGHWSRDCPSSSSSAAAAAATATAPNPNSNSNSNTSRPYYSKPKPVDKPKKAPKTRPKLTPELLLSDDGIGYLLRHFPRAVKYRGRGHEVSDLGNLIGLYKEWHSHVLPYYSFEHFILKVEKVAATRRVKMCIEELRERVARGGDPTKLKESEIVDDDVNNEKEAKDSQGWWDTQEEASLKNIGADGLEEDMLQEIYEKATEEPAQQHLQSESITAVESTEGLANEEPNPSNSNETQITEEQRARMEANRLKALERAKAKAARPPISG